MNILLNEAIAKVKNLSELEQERIAKLIMQEITENTFKKTDQGKDLIKSENVEEMFNKLGI